MGIGIITLGREGVIKDTASKIDWIMSCFFFTKYRQTQLFQDEIISLPKIIQQNIDDPVKVKEELEVKLNVYLERFFTRVLVEVDYELNDDNTSTIILDLNVSDDDNVDSSLISVGYSLTYEGSNLSSILENHSGRELLEQDTNVLRSN